MNAQKATQRVHLRWCVRRDLAEVMTIEEQQRDSLSEEELLTLFRQKNVIAMVAEHRERVVGVYVYRLQKDRLDLLRMATDYDMRRRGVGSQMVAKLKEKMNSHRRTRILIDVPDWNLDAHLFLRAMGFRATSVSGGDYRFECKVDA